MPSESLGAPLEVFRGRVLKAPLKTGNGRGEIQSPLAAKVEIYFQPSYPWHLAEDLDKKPDIQAMISLWRAIEPLKSKFGKTVRQLAGPRAVDCGETYSWRARTVADECAADAFQAGKPFLVLYHLQGIDSARAEALVLTP